MTTALLAACSPQPCTSCLQIRGSYLETVQGGVIGCGGGQYLSIGDGNDQIELDQTGSALSIVVGELADGLSGALNQDGSASFGPIPVTFSPVDAEGNPDPAGMPIPGKLYLDGFFTSSSGGAVSFEGTYRLVADTNGCELDARAQWTR